jgi:hypothetical protein
MTSAVGVAVVAMVVVVVVWMVVAVEVMEVVVAVVVAGMGEAGPGVPDLGRRRTTIGTTRLGGATMRIMGRIRGAEGLTMAE